MKLTNRQIAAAFSNDGDSDWEDTPPEAPLVPTVNGRQFPQFVKGIFCVDHGYGLVCAACAGYGGQWGHVTDFSAPFYARLAFIPCKHCEDGQPTLLLGYTPQTEQNFAQDRGGWSDGKGGFHPMCKACDGHGYSYGHYHYDDSLEPKYGSITCPKCKGTMTALWSFQVVSRGYTNDK